MRWLFVALVAAGCGGRTEVHWRFEFGPRFSDAALASIAAIHLFLEEVTVFETTAPVPARALEGREGRLVYIPSSKATSVTGGFDFLDGGGGLVVHAFQPTVQLSPGHALELTLTLDKPFTGGDLAEPTDAASDLSVGDLAEDLSVSLDQSVPLVDLGGRDLAVPQAAGCPDGGLWCESFEEYSSESQLEPSGRWHYTADVDLGESLTIDTANGAKLTSHSLKIGYSSGFGYVGPNASPSMQFQLPLFLRFYARGVGTQNPMSQAQLVTLYSQQTGNEVEIDHDSQSPQGLFVSVLKAVSYFPVGPSSATLSTTGFDCWELDVHGTVAELYKNGSAQPVAWVTYGPADGGAMDMQPFSFPDGVLTFEVGTPRGNGATASPAFAIEYDELLVGSQHGLCP